MSEPILQCTGLCKNYGQKTALDNVTFSLQRGRIIGLLGPNGSGKSTLMKLANGLLTPSSGEIRIAGNVPGIETHAIVSYLPERTYFSDWMTADDLLNFFQDFYSDFNINKAADMLTHLGIQPRDTLKTMSKGTKEKIQLVVVMSREADLYWRRRSGGARLHSQYHSDQLQRKQHRADFYPLNFRHRKGSRRSSVSQQGTVGSAKDR